MLQKLNHRFLLPLLLFAGVGFAQQNSIVLPNCSASFVFTTASSTRQLDNRQSGCTSWVFTYSSTGFSVLSIVFQSAPDNNGVPGSWSTFAGTVVTGSNPSTATTQAGLVVTGYYPWVRVLLSSVTGTGTIRGTFQSYSFSTRFGGGGPPSGAAGGCLSGTYPNPGLANLTIAGGVTFVNGSNCLAEDAVNFFWDNTLKRLGIGLNNATAQFQVQGTLTAGVARLSNSQVTVLNTNEFGRLSFYSNDASGSGAGEVANILSVATTDQTGGNFNTAIVFSTNGPSSAASAIERARITSNGNMLLGGLTTDRNYKFLINGSGSVGATAIVDPTAVTGFTLVDIGYDGTNTSALTTQLRIRPGATQGNNNTTQWLDTAAVLRLGVSANGVINSGAAFYDPIYFGGLTSAASLVSIADTSIITVRNTGSFNWVAGSNPTAAKDTGVTRNAAGLVEINNGATIAAAIGNARDFTLRSLIANGTSPSFSSGTIITGSRNAAGGVTSGTTGAFSTIITFAGTTAPVGWSCQASNNTTPANLISQTAYTTTSATIGGTTVSGDVITYGCVAF